MIPSFKLSTLEQIANVLGNMQTGLTGSKIGSYLAECNIIDPMPGENKRDRLFKAFKTQQEKDRCANNICNFIQRAMDPVLYTNMQDHFKEKQSELNITLAFEGLRLDDQGKIVKGEQAQTISQAEAAANQLKQKLIARGVHADVLKFCRAELIKENYFHAVLEAAKSVAQKIRDKSGFKNDGCALVDDAFGIGKKDFPIIAFNSLQTDSERSEHIGLTNLMKGFFGVFRHPTAHAPKLLWQMTEQDALDMMTLASLIHRRLDTAVRTNPLSIIK